MLRTQIHRTLLLIKTLAESARILQYAPDEQTRDCVVTGIERILETDLPVELEQLLSAKRSTKRLSSRPRNKPQAISPVVTVQGTLAVDADQTLFRAGQMT